MEDPFQLFLSITISFFNLIFSRLKTGATYLRLTMSMYCLAYKYFVSEANLTRFIDFLTGGLLPSTLPPAAPFPSILPGVLV